MSLILRNPLLFGGHVALDRHRVELFRWSAQLTTRREGWELTCDRCDFLASGVAAGCVNRLERQH